MLAGVSLLLVGPPKLDRSDKVAVPSHHSSIRLSYYSTLLFLNFLVRKNNFLRFSDVKPFHSLKPFHALSLSKNIRVYNFITYIFSVYIS